MNQHHEYEPLLVWELLAPEDAVAVAVAVAVAAANAALNGWAQIKAEQ